MVHAGTLRRSAAVAPVPGPCMQCSARSMQAFTPAVGMRSSCSCSHAWFDVFPPCTCAGVQYPLEAQIISAIPQDQLAACPAEGCQVGTSVMFALEDDPTLINAFLDSAIPYIPYNGAVRAALLTLIRAACCCCFGEA